ITTEDNRTTAISNEVYRREECATWVCTGFFPLQLIERFQRNIRAQANRGVHHINRQQTFFYFSTWLTESRSIHRVNAINPPLDKGTFTPANYLTTYTQVNRCCTQLHISPDVSIH